MTTRARILEEARTWIDTPYHHLGRKKFVGVDCAGLIIGVANNLGISEFDTKTYSRLPDVTQLRSHLKQHLDSVEIRNARAGDILLLRFQENPQHLAILSQIDAHGKKHIIHSYAQVRKCVEHICDDTWEKRIIAAYQYRGIF